MIKEKCIKVDKNKIVMPKNFFYLYGGIMGGLGGIFMLILKYFFGA